MSLHFILRMFRKSIVVAIVGLVSRAIASEAIRNASRHTRFRPGAAWLDTGGGRIRAHQPYVYRDSQHPHTYYMYGAAKVGHSDGEPGEVNVYTSSDLYNWEYRGVAAKFNYAARVSVLGKNPHTSKYVMWSKGGSFLAAESNSLLGPFVKVGNFDPLEGGDGAGDSHAFRDPTNNNAYIFYSFINPREIRVARLTENWTALSASPIATVGSGMEAPLPFYSGLANKYFVWTSHCSGWNPNAATLFSADSVEGPWLDLGNPSNSTSTFGTQGSHVLPISRVGDVERLLYQSDRYIPFINETEGSRYVFLPLEVNKRGNATLRNFDWWSLEHWPATYTDAADTEIVCLIGYK
eukprot:TRINITY_DN10525_c0_g1_i2.p1 TRINITY_DN10525_c0_g1~~TRINITY_DN10525_c0_g1_i2.p1  ORF type:complete len:351 (-),score=19.99 TRINITY_DN10525_c0_g1_i2:27-1079(-)